MFESKRQQGIHDRWNYLLTLVGKERKDIAKAKGVGQANLTNWLNRESGFTKGAFVTLERYFREQGVEGLTYDWLNSGVGEAPVASGPRIATSTAEPAANRGFGERSSPVEQHGYVRFQFLKGFSREESPFIDISLHQIAGDPAFLSEWIQVFKVSTDTMRGEIEKGDLVFADTSVRNVAIDKLQDGVYVYKLDGNVNIRRIQNRGKGVLRLSGTHSYEDSHELSGAELDGFEIGGQVVGFIAKRRL